MYFSVNIFKQEVFSVAFSFQKSILGHHISYSVAAILVWSLLNHMGYLQNITWSRAA